MKPNKLLFRSALLLFIPLCLLIPEGQGQTTSEIYHELQKLKETKRVLYIAAHPDDENTRLIAYLANKEHVQVAYMSLTRGDGGQNLIGKELGIELGMIRTQELLKARETDGGRQYFSRAIDFGYSRNPDETLNNWDKEKLLSDVIWVIRKFQPDIIITRFNTTPGTTHGHHTTSAIIAGEAFEKSGDPNVFPGHLKWHAPWKAQRLFWNAYSWGAQYEPKEDKLYHRFPVGEFNPILGTTYSKIAADSRTMHKSQGFGATAQIGEGVDFIELVKGEKFEDGPFEGIGSRWEELENGEVISTSITSLLENFDFVHPENNLNDLLSIKRHLQEVQEESPWVQEKLKSVDKLIVKVLGIQALYLSNKELSFPTDEFQGRLIVNNPGKLPVKLHNFETIGRILEIDTVLADNKPLNMELSLLLPEDYPISQPYWLENPPENNLYQVEDQEMIGLAFNAPAVSGTLSMEIMGEELMLDLPLQFRYNDQVDGEVIQPFTVLPTINLEIDQENVFLLNNNPNMIKVTVGFEEGKIVEGKLSFDGLEADGYSILEKSVEPEKNQLIFTVELMDQDGPEKSLITASYLTDSGDTFRLSKRRILHEHIPNLTYFQTASFNLIRLQMDLSEQRIGYIPGAGDDVPGVLTNLGYQVEMLENGNLNRERLQNYQTIIIGIRAFNVNQELANNVDELMAYVNEGGNLIVQYNTISPLLTRALGPYPLEISRDRITVEGSPVKFEALDHPTLQFPNEIKAGDFDGWVQERGLYFPGTWDEKYQTPLIMRDPNENETKGALLLADYGAGKFTYSGISWFRLLPAGVPGAIKLFVNLIEQNSEERERVSELE